MSEEWDCLWVGCVVGVEMSDPLLVGCQSLPRGCHLVPTMPRCVSKIEGHGSFLASRE